MENGYDLSKKEFMFNDPKEVCRNKNRNVLRQK